MEAWLAWALPARAAAASGAVQGEVNSAVAMTRARVSLPRRGGAAQESEGRMGPSSLEGGWGERERRCRRESARRPGRFRYGFGYGASGGSGGGDCPGSAAGNAGSPWASRSPSPNCEPDRNASMRGEATPHPFAAAARPDRMRPSMHQGGRGNAGHYPPFGTGASAPRRWLARASPRPRNSGAIPRTEGGALRRHAGSRRLAPRHPPGPLRRAGRGGVPRQCAALPGPLQHPRPHRLRGVGGYPAADRGRRQYRHRAGHRHRLVGRPAYLCRQGGRAGRCRRLPGQALRRLGLAGGEVRAAARHRQMDRHPDRRQYRPLLLAHLRGEGGRLRQRAGRP